MGLAGHRYAWLVVIFLVMPWQECESQIVPFMGMITSSFKTYEEPPYDVVANFSQNVEERKYSAANWACTVKTEAPANIDDQIRNMFMLLFTYIQGNNEGNHQIEMTVPVTNKVVQKTTEENEYTMCFYVPPKFQQNPPQPKDENVKIVGFPALHVYSKRYSGYTSQERESQYLAELQDILKTNGISFYEQEKGLNATHFVNGYDSPIKFWNRRNEVWLLAQE